MSVATMTIHNVPLKTMAGVISLCNHLLIITHYGGEQCLSHELEIMDLKRGESVIVSMFSEAMSRKDLKKTLEDFGVDYDSIEIARS